MRQLPLRIVPRLSYSSDNFVVHSGIEPSLGDLRGILDSPGFSLTLLTGEARSGKSHLAIWLVDRLSEAARFARLLSGAELHDWLHAEFLETPIGEDVIFIVDEAEVFFERLARQDSGPFVRFFETCRLAQAKLVFLSRISWEDFSVDSHAMSRLRTGFEFVLQAPGDHDFPQIIQHMARQRGVSLGEKKVGYIFRRTGRSVASIERCLDRVAHLSEVLGKRIDLALLADAIGDGGE